MAPDLVATEDQEPNKRSPEKEGPETPGSDSNSRPSLGERAEREIELHPDHVTEGVDLGVQKAEAAALVWSKKALVCIYAW